MSSLRSIPDRPAIRSEMRGNPPNNLGQACEMALAELYFDRLVDTEFSMTRLSPLGRLTVLFTLLSASAAFGATDTTNSEVRAVSHLLAAGLGADELASAGCSAEDVRTLLAGLRPGNALVADLESTWIRLCSLESAQRAYRQRLRASPSRTIREEQASAPDAAELDAEKARFAEFRADLRSYAMGFAQAPAPVCARIFCSHPSSRMIGAAWRANLNDEHRQVVVSRALAQSAIADAAGVPVPTDAAVVLLEEQARPDTAGALANFERHAAAIRAVFLEWAQASE